MKSLLSLFFVCCVILTGCCNCEDSLDNNKTKKPLLNNDQIIREVKKCKGAGMDYDFIVRWNRVHEVVGVQCIHPQER